MKRRVPASQSTRKKIEALISGKEGQSERSELAAELIIEEALEGEVDESLGRAYYARGGGEGQRNGYRELSTAEGRIEYAVMDELRASVREFEALVRSRHTARP